MVDWLPGNPGAGDFSGLESAVVVLRACVDRGGAVADGVGSSRDVIRQAWPDENGGLWAQSATGVVDRASQVATVCSGLPDAIGTFLDVVGVIDSRYRGYRDDIEDAVAAATRHGIRCRLVGGGGGSGVFGSPAPFGSSGSRASVWGPVDPVFGFGRPVCEYVDPADRLRPASFAVTPESTEAIIGEALAGIGGLYRDRDEADRVLSDALTGAIPPAWAAQKAVLVEAGYVGVQPLSPTQIGGAWAARVRAGDLDAGALEGFFAEYASNQQVMSVFFDRVGGRGTVRLLEVLAGGSVEAGDVDGRVLEFARDVRAGFVFGSSGWGGERAAAFAEDMFAGIDSADLGSVVGAGPRINAMVFLFDGPPYAGQEVAVAVADRLDAAERSGLQLVALGDRPNGRGLIAADRAERGLPVPGTWETIDLADPVLRTLAQHPGAALGWLASPAPDTIGGTGEVGQARVEYWFAERSWGTFSSFETPLLLLNTVQDPSLRVVDPATGELADTQAWVDVATVTARGLEGLVTNNSWAPETVNEREAVLLADLLTANLIAIQTGWIDRQSDTANKNEDFYFDGTPKYGVRPVPMAAFGEEVLKKAFGAASMTTEGADRLAAGYNLYLETMIQAAMASGEPPHTQVVVVSDLMADAIDRIEGAADWALLDVAARADATTMAVLGLVMTGVGVATAGIGTPTVLTAMALTAGVSAGTMTATEVAGPMAAHRTADAQAQIAALTEERYLQERESDLLVTARLLGVQLPDPPAPPPARTDGPSVLTPAFFDRQEDWYQTCRELVNDAYNTQSGGTQFDVHDKAERHKSERQEDGS